MKRAAMMLVCVAFLATAPSFAQGPMRDPETIGYKPLPAEAVESAPEFAEYKSVFTSSTLDLGTPKWQSAPGYTRYADPKLAALDVSKAGVERSVLRLRTQLGSSAAFASSTDNAKLLATSLIAAIDAYAAAVDALKPFEPVPTPEPEFQATDASIAGFSTDICFFAGSARQVVLAGKKTGAAPQPPGPAVTTRVYYATLEQAIEFRAVADAMIAIFRKVKEKPAAFTQDTFASRQLLERASAYPPVGRREHMLRFAADCQGTSKVAGRNQI